MGPRLVSGQLMRSSCKTPGPLFQWADDANEKGCRSCWSCWHCVLIDFAERWSGLGSGLGVIVWCRDGRGLMFYEYYKE